MEKITDKSPESRSPDLVAENIAKLKELFPELLTEGENGSSVNLDVLKQLVGDQTVTDAEEKYGLNWHGKRKARQLALTPSTGTLRPCQEDSVDWDTTQNLMIEGDNLEVLKLLQKSYAGKVKLIYIDPPYNTGKDFVYPDNFQDNIKNYLELTGQTGEGGKKLSSNTEASGRFHTDWLNMIYPRLKLARNLLREDGLLFVSISDNEQARLRSLCDDVFGEENFVAQLIWMKGKEGGNDNDGFGMHHDYLICYAKSHDKGVASIVLDEKDVSRHITRLPEENLVLEGDSIYKDGEQFQLINLSKQKDYWVKIPLKDGSVIEWDSYCPQKTIDSYIQCGKMFIGERRVPYVKSFLSDEAAGSKPSTLIGSEHGTTKAGGIAIRDLFGDGKIFSYPKPPALIQRILKIGCDASKESNPMVMDFFAGSGTTGHSVFAQNATDGGRRKCILVQFPEQLEHENRDQKQAAEFCEKLGKPRTIAELTKERLRRAGAKIKEDNPMFSGDIGFRVFKLDSTNIREWDPNRENLAESLEASVDHLKSNRTDDDILFELLLKLGLDLCVPMEQRKIAGKTVHSIGAGVLITCLDKSISRADAEPLALGILAWLKELNTAGDSTLVFRDSGFADDVAKTNLSKILEQNGIAAKNIRSI
jgi:adenine-specific DNA-methyltransferase